MSQATTIVFDLPPAVDAADAAALIAEMSRLPRANAIILNAAAVASVSLGYLQILVSAFKTFPKLTVSAASAEFAEAFGGYGIAYPFAAQTPAEVAAPPAKAAPTILTIDDSRTMRDMLRLALGGAGFTVVQAVDGQDGLKVLPQQPVDLIITDINMPKLDGYGVIRAIRGDPAYNDTPILVLSTEAEQASKNVANEAGANGWIVKPFDPDGLVKLVSTFCE
jgi:two-component system chemotaxis response regulator CheY